MSNDKLLWVDTETFGLEPSTDPIIEVALILTDFDLNTIDSVSWTVWDDIHDTRIEKLRNDAEAGDKDAIWVLGTHEKSGLWEDAYANGMEFKYVISRIEAFFTAHKLVRLPMVGNNVPFDRAMLKAWMPEAEALFHYRNIDISSVKELCKVYNPPVFAHAPEKQEKHRAAYDIRESIEEFRFYRDEFLVW